MDPFVAEIRIFPFNFAPKGWAFCDGQLLPLSQNTALFSLLGTTYGGDGKCNFALPDMQGNAPMHPGQGPGLSLHDLGETGGSQTVTLLESRNSVAYRIHAWCRYGDATSRTASQSMLAKGVGGTVYSDATAPMARCRIRRLAPGRRRPAAQQHAALSHAELLHRPAGRVPAADLSDDTCLRRGATQFMTDLYEASRALLPGYDGEPLPVRDREHLVRRLGAEADQRAGHGRERHRRSGPE